MNATTGFSGNGVNLRELQLRLPNQVGTDAPFLRVPLHLPMMRAGSIHPQTTANTTIEFDDFVFRIIHSPQ